MEVRVSGILSKQNSILLVAHQKPTERYWVLPGGHVDRGETLEQALFREWKEELGLDVEQAELKGVGTCIGGNLHRIEFFFGVEAPTDQPLTIAEVAEARFYPLRAIEQIDFRPQALHSFLLAPPSTCQYLGNLYR